jgi:hypothetical protein
MIKEYGNCSDNERSTKTIMKTGTGAFNRTIELIEVTEGYEPAGSAMRHTKAGYRVCTYDPFSNNRYSTQYKWFSEASERFYALTTAIESVKS